MTGGHSIEKKVHSLSKKKIDEIYALIGASFRDYPYGSGEGGSKPFFPSKAAMTEYMKSFVIAGMESGTFYSTDHGEGYILITDKRTVFLSESGAGTGV